jgi:hypothetical protein
VNLLVAAHANGIVANEIFTAEGGWEMMPQLASAAREDPFINSKILEALLYNAVYMDMELDESEMLEKGFNYIGMGVTPEMQAVMEASGEYDTAFPAVLATLDEINCAVYGEIDPDIEALLTYFDAKSNQ